MGKIKMPSCDIVFVLFLICIIAVFVLDLILNLIEIIIRLKRRK